MRKGWTRRIRILACSTSLLAVHSLAAAQDPPPAPPAPARAPTAETAAPTAETAAATAEAAAATAAAPTAAVAPWPSVAPSEPPSPSSRTYAYATGGLAIAAVAVGALYGVRALAASSDYKQNPTVDNIVTGEGYATISTASFILAGVLAGATLLIWFSSSEPPKRAESRPLLRF